MENGSKRFKRFRKYQKFRFFIDNLTKIACVQTKRAPFSVWGEPTAIGQAKMQTSVCKTQRAVATMPSALARMWGISNDVAHSVIATF